MGAGGGGDISTHTLTITTTGSNGSASGSAVTSPIEGYLLDVYVNYHASAPGATTDLTLKQTDRTEVFLTLTDTATDGYYAPRMAVHTNAGVAVTNGCDLIPINGTITGSIAQSNALTGCCVVTVRVLEL